MAISLPDTRQLSDETLEALRLRSCELGFTQADVAHLTAALADRRARDGRSTRSKRASCNR